MKMMKRMQTVALSVALTGLSTLPVWAFTGEVDPSAVAPDTVTCINYTTNESVPGQLLSSGQFDCSGLDYQQGEHIGVVLSGLAGSGPGPVDPGRC